MRLKRRSLAIDTAILLLPFRYQSHETDRILDDYHKRAHRRTFRVTSDDHTRLAGLGRATGLDMTAIIRLALDRGRKRHPHLFEP